MLKNNRDLKPGDLYVLTAEAASAVEMQIGETTHLFGDPGIHRMKLVERHRCGALEFLVMEPEQ